MEFFAVSFKWNLSLNCRGAISGNGSSLSGRSPLTLINVYIYVYIYKYIYISFFYNKKFTQKINKQKVHTAVPQRNIFFVEGKVKIKIYQI